MCHYEKEMIFKNQTTWVRKDEILGKIRDLLLFNLTVNLNLYKIVQMNYHQAVIVHFHKIKTKLITSSLMDTGHCYKDQRASKQVIRLNLFV